MSINLIDAASAYGRSFGGITPVGKSSPANGTGESSAPGSDFGDMVTNMVSSTAATLGKAETASIRQVAGKGDLIDVVTAMGAAETALDTMIAVRDKVVSAYGEIMRMQI
jgi:flagellar hook-basal body complex protein FliE